MNAMTALTTFPADKRDLADAYAAEIGGYVDEHYNEYGTLAVCHDQPDGLAVRLWSNITLPEGTVLVRRGTVQVDDVVVSSHSGKRRVVSADLRGNEPGTMYLRLEGINSGPEAYPGDSVIPLVSRMTLTSEFSTIRFTGAEWFAGQTEPKKSYEYAAVLVDTDRLVGLGPTLNRSTASEDVRAWRADGYTVALRKRPVAAWEDDNDPLS